MNKTLEKILDLIKQKGITEKFFLQEMGLNATALSDWKKGVNSSYNKHINKIAQYFNVSTDYLLGNETRHHPLRDEDIKFALYGTDKISDEMFDAVKTFVEVQKRKLEEQGLL